MNNRKQHSGYANRPFNTALPALLGNKLTHDDLPKVNNDEIDGVHHFNVHHHGKSDLGKALSMHSEYPLIHPKYGSFKTVFGLIAWLSNPNQPDSYRQASAKDVDAALKKTDKTHLPDFGYQVMWATWYKIKSHPKIENWLRESELRFEHYFIQKPLHPVTGKRGDPLRVRNNSSVWMISGMEELRRAVKENREPELDFILPQRERDKLNRQRKLDAQKNIPKETDVILEANLRKNDAPGAVKKERTPEQLERKRQKNKAMRERRSQRREEGAMSRRLDEKVGAGDPAVSVSRQIPEPEAELCTIGIKDIDVISPEGIVELNMSEIKRLMRSPEDQKTAQEEAVRHIQEVIDSDESVHIGDINREFVTDWKGQAFLGHFRLNGIKLTYNANPVVTDGS